MLDAPLRLDEGVREMLRNLTSLLIRALAIAVLGASIGVLVNGVRSDGVSLGAFGSATLCVAPHSTPGIEVLAPTEAVRVCGDHGTIVADARAAGRFAQGHVAGALHLPCAASGREASDAMTRLEGKHTVLVYGDSTDEARPVAEDIRRRVSRSGLRVIVIDGGFSAWDSAGLACSSGPCPDCKDELAKKAASR